MMGAYLFDRDRPGALPRLALGHSYWALQALPQPPEHYLETLHSTYGFETLEVGLRPEALATVAPLARKAGLKLIGQGWAETLERALPYLDLAVEHGVWALNLHLGHAFMSARQSADLAKALLDVAARKHVLLMFETHRGRMTQDLYRTAEWVDLVPDVRLCLDVSHFIVACEGFGGSEALFHQHLTPLLDRTAMIHGRIGDNECVQSDVSRPGEQWYVARFLAIWKQAMAAFIRQASPGSVLVFTPELGPPPYAQVDGAGQQTSDRWIQSLALAELARQTWKELVG